MNQTGLRARSPFPPRSDSQSSSQMRRSDSSSSESSASSQVTAVTVYKSKSSNVGQTQPSRSMVGSSTQGSSGAQNFSRPTTYQSHSDQTLRTRSPVPTSGTPQHSQGFFEPSLPSSSGINLNMANLSASQIAAQAAMHHQAQQHARKRSQTGPSSNSPTEAQPATGRRKANSPALVQGHLTVNTTGSQFGGQQYQNGLPGSHSLAATTAANVVFPRNPPPSPGVPSDQFGDTKDGKQRAEKSKMKLFSKPKSIGITKDKDMDRKDRPLLSPTKTGSYGPPPLPRMASSSTISLVDSAGSSSSTMYQSTNSSSATLTPITEKTVTLEKEKQHKHNFLSRSKHKLKDKDDHHHLPLSSAASNSKPLDPSAPQSLYSFVPSSPGPTSTSFSKSVSGLDLRHGGRALREKKKEEKANAAANASFDPALRETEFSYPGAGEWSGNVGSNAASNLGQATSNSASTYGGVASLVGDASQSSGFLGFGLSSMTPDDAWPFLKARLLIIFEGEDLRLPVEDFNRLVSMHIQRCFQKRAPQILTEDLNEFLQTGFFSLDLTLRPIPDERLVPYLVDMWLAVFGTILPYMQAVFLPLDLEFKGAGTIMTCRESQDFWGGLPQRGSSDHPLREVQDVRRIVLKSYRDNVILPRHDSLKAIFSRLSLESINGALTSDPLSSSLESTANGRAILDPGLASYNSQSSTLLNESAASLGGGITPGNRSRAISNVSSTTSSHPETLVNLNPYNTSIPAQQQAAKDSVRVTETVGRMLQCISVLASVQSGDEAQAKMEGLAKTLKLNWLGRGRTGRNRRGFVGARVVRRPTGGAVA